MESSSMPAKKVALITGGASGMGLAVATALSHRPNWTIHILDLQPPPAPLSLQNTTFHTCNVTDEATLSEIFSAIHASSHRLDFVFANAGIAERANFYDSHDDDDNDDGDEDSTSTGPPLPVKGMHALIDINLKSVITTTYLALHYMRRSPRDCDKSIVMTASCGGIYPSYYSPIYTATKHGVVGFMRSIAPFFLHKAGVRVNAICPGTVRTNLLTGEEWANFPEEYFTPVEKIVQVVCMLVDGVDDGMGRVGREVEGTGEGGRVLSGRAVEISGTNYYYREMVPYADEAMTAVMGSTNIEVLENVQPA
ncbi:NAD(P)-binding protein [Pyrenochaeta sp. DS3sAY3a]|nr:NAD(P)-binding protein [Pyrenochaeta sp. DS3sAY3a]